MPAAEELIGRRLVDDRGRILTVVGPTSWNPSYWELESGDVYRTVRKLDLLLRYDAWLDTPGKLCLTDTKPVEHGAPGS